ncbi:MAG: hypothetical protein DCF31_14535 [Alphaproteobacteria bacterium]|nr:MAG: hypothetical protein DCF31_14535 [Alphaproteobacteria bacterium]
MQRNQVNGLDPSKPHWVAAVEAPSRDWSAVPGCRAHARFLVDGESKAPSLSQFELFDSRAECLAWIMANRRELSDHMPGAKIHPVPLADWLLGLS